jgi:hypothetical protein
MVNHHVMGYRGVEVSLVSQACALPLIRFHVHSNWNVAFFLIAVISGDITKFDE